MLIEYLNYNIVKRPLLSASVLSPALDFEEDKEFTSRDWGHNSAVECLLHIGVVLGVIFSTTIIKNYQKQQKYISEFFSGNYIG